MSVLNVVNFCTTQKKNFLKLKKVKAWDNPIIKGWGYQDKILTYTKKCFFELEKICSLLKSLIPPTGANFSGLFLTLSSCSLHKLLSLSQIWVSFAIMFWLWSYKLLCANDTTNPKYICSHQRWSKILLLKKQNHTIWLSL